MEKLGISEQLIEQLPDAVLVVDSTGSILFVNAQGENLFGWSRAELIGKAIEVLDRPTPARTTRGTAPGTWPTRRCVRWAPAWTCSVAARTARSSRRRSRCPRSRPSMGDLSPRWSGRDRPAEDPGQVFRAP
ncbi:MAG: PAS domain-containing protein [Sporichthya sp.]|nr:PAS domain-containing protein [Sporichthya sp.]